MNLEQSEFEAIAGLLDHLGYKLLLDKVQAELDTMQQEILLDSNIDHQKVNYWKSLYRIFTVFKTVPANLKQELQNLKINNVYENPQENIPQEYMTQLLQEYMNRKKMVE